MSVQVRVLLIVASIAVFIYLMYKIKQSQMRIEDSLFWIFLSGIFLMLSIFPGIAFRLAAFLGIGTTMNLVLLVIIFLLIIKLFRQSVKLSELEYKMRSFVQEETIKDAGEKSGE